MFFDNLSVSATLASSTPTSTPPTITLVGDALVHLSVGGTYIEQGATAYDAEEGTFATSSIQISTVPDTNQAGTTTIVYSVSDSSGLSASTTRTVVVGFNGGDLTPPPEENGSSTATSTPPSATSTPPENATTTPFASTSVLFFPGITGSQLFHQNDGMEDKLWDSLSLLDLNYLKMNEAGASEHSDIFARGLVQEIASATGLWSYREVYAGWQSFLEKLTREKVIHDWRAFPYDWRLATNVLTQTGRPYETGTSFLGSPQEESVLEDLLRELASASPSGKVTLIGHSNGGLVIKNWLHALEERNSPLLSQIETVLLVGSPQIGTPEALTTVLHGTTPTFSTMRDVLEEMPGMLGLLPSEAFFSRATYAPIFFEPSVKQVPGFSTYASTSIRSYADLASFLTGGEEKRSKPSKGNTDIPNVLGTNLLSDARDMHRTIDAWRAPSSLHTIQLAGEGLSTIASARYLAEEDKDDLLHELRFSYKGDGTVLTESADAGSFDETYYAYLDTYNTIEGTNYKHGTLLSMPPVQDFVEQILSGKGTTTSRFVLPSRETTKKRRFAIAVHSPVEVHLFDSVGRHTGVVAGDAGDAGSLFEEKVPNSYYREWGEVKYAGADLEGGDVRVHLVGQETGTFTLVLETFDGEEKVRTDTFAHIPTLAHASGTILLRVGEVPTLHYDIDNDGVVDVELVSGAPFVWPPVLPKDGGAGAPLFSRGAGGAGDASLQKKSSQAKVIFEAPVVFLSTSTKKEIQTKATSTLFSQNLGVGMRGEAVRLLQERLRAEGVFTYPESTGFFGAITREAVRAFQEAHPAILFRTGFVGERTRAVLNGGEPPEESLAFAEGLAEGARGEAVYHAQALLRKEGFFSAHYDSGVFDGTLKESVLAFQKAHHLAQTGVFDAPTCKVLGV